MKKKRFRSIKYLGGLLFGLFVGLFSCSFVNGELIDKTTGNTTQGGVQNTWLELGVGESGNFDTTYVNMVGENNFDIEYVGNGNWNYTVGTDTYYNIYRLNNNHEGNNYSLGFYYFRTQTGLVFVNSEAGTTILIDSFLKTDTTNYTEISTFTNSNNYTYTLTDILSEIGTVNKIAFGTHTNNNRLGVRYTSDNLLCFISGENVYCASCMGGLWGSIPSCKGNNNTTVNYGVPSGTTINDILSLGIVSESPFVGGGSGGGEIIFDTGFITNDMIFDAFLTYGYYTGLCYSDFDIGDLAVNTGDNVFDQFFTGYSLNSGSSYGGADYFDLVSSTNLSEYSFFNMYNPSFGYSYSNGTLSSFAGKPKGFWRIFYKINNPSNFISIGVSDYINFCDMVINGFTGSDIFTGSINPLVIDNWFSNGRYLYSGGGVGFLSGEDLKLDPEAFFSGLTSRFNAGFSRVEDGIVGVIPTYILLVMFALIFIRIISH